MKAIRRMLGRLDMRGMRKRALASALALLMIFSMVPTVWLAASAAGDGFVCGLKEHTHGAECYSAEPTCGIAEGEQYELHAHSDACRTSTLTCGVEESEEHAHSAGCYVSELTCGIEEGASVPVGTHAHDAGCYALVCEKPEHAHTDECEAAREEVSSADAKVNSVKSGTRAAGTGLSVSGVWDVGSAEQGHENIAFDSSEIATISHDSNQASEQVNVRISVNFPENASDPQLKINLKPGLKWLVNGETTIPKTALESVSTLQDETVFVKNLGNGTYIYDFKDGVTSVDVDIVVEKLFWTNFPSITDAITAEVSCIQDGSSVSDSTALTTLHPQQYEQHIMRSSISARTKAGEQLSLRNGLRIGSHLTSAAEKDRYRLYEYIQFTINAPSEVIYGGVHKEDSSEGSPNKYWQMVGEPEALDDGTTNYTFRAEGLYNMYFSSTHYWTFPESMIGQEVKIITTDFRWKVYGDTVEGTIPANKVGTATVTVVDPDARDEKTQITGSSHSVYYNPDAPDALYQLSAWSLRNNGTDPSEPKIVELEFDTEKIGVAAVDLLFPPRKTITRIWYKVEGSDQWQEKTITLPTTYSNGSAYFYHSQLRNVDLGLSEDTYFAALKYELDYVDDNGTPEDTTDDFRYGIPAGLSTVGYGSIYAPIVGVVKDAFHADTSKALCTARVYDKTEEGEAIVNDTGKVDISARYSTKLNNFLSTVNEDVIKTDAGNTLTFNTIIKAYWSSTSDRAFIVGFHPYPVIYIRDETGEGISNVRLTNGLGVELFAKYPGIVTLELDHTETIDHNGDGKLAKVYRIDTSGLRSMASFEDRYAACIGACDISGDIRNMTLTYSITTSSAYNDGQTVHYTADAVYVTDEGMENKVQRNKRNIIADEFDVDSDGLTDTDKSIVAPNNGFSPGYYIITARADISVSAGVRKTSSDGAYTSWDGSDSYVQVQPGISHDARFSVLNGSGVTTSTEEDKMTYIYIPVPKAGQQWGAANSGIAANGDSLTAFAYDMVLTGAVGNPDDDVFTVSYGTVDTSGFGAGNTYGTVGKAIKESSTAWSGSYSEATNCVRIAVKGMEPSDAAKHFVLPVSAVEDADNRAVNIYSAIYYEDITNENGKHFSGWYSSDRLALQIAEGELSGRIWQDLNGNGIQDRGEPGISGATVTLSGESTSTAVTDADGVYSFKKLAVGEYSVSYAYDSAVCALSAANAGSSDAADSDAEVIDGKAVISAITIPSADSMGKTTYSVTDMDMGLAPMVTVEYAWHGTAPSRAVLPDSASIPAGTEYTAAAAAPVTGYTFDGWYTDEDCTAAYTDGTAITGDTVLYGSWDRIMLEVSGTIDWVDVPDGETVPDIAVRLVHGGSAVGPVTVPSGIYSYGFTAPAYNEDGTAAVYTAEVEEVPGYTAAVSTPVTQDDGSVVIDITLTRRTGSLTVKNTVIGGDDEFTFTVTVGRLPGAQRAYALNRAAVQYHYTGSAEGYLSPGVPAEFTLKNGEAITVESVHIGTAYTVEQKAHPDYYTTPAGLTASGAVAADTNVEEFVNSKIPLGTLTVTTKVTGSGADRNTIFEYKVTIDSEDSFEYAVGETAGTLSSGDVLRLKHGESAVIYGIKEGTGYSVEQVADQGYKKTSTGASGKVTAQGITASFINTKEDKVAGSTAGPDTGDHTGTGAGAAVAVNVMQSAMLMMLFCAWQLRRRREES